MSRIKDSTDKLTVGNGVNGVNMASRKASKHKIPSHVHLVAPTDESRKKESSWSEHTWSKYLKFIQFRGGNYVWNFRDFSNQLFLHSLGN